MNKLINELRKLAIQNNQALPPLSFHEGTNRLSNKNDLPLPDEINKQQKQIRQALENLIKSQIKI